MKRIVITSTLLISLASFTFAQDKVWTLDEVMQYAVDNSPKVKQKIYETSNAKADYLSAVGDFLPNISANTNVTYGFGRAIDPATNTYVNNNFFENYYNLYGSIPLFTGGQLINQWKQAKVNRLYSKSDESVAKNELALNTMQAYMDVIFNAGMVDYAAEKLEESSRILLQTRRQEELGLKSKADVAQIEAQVAADDYALTNYQNLYNTNLLTLKEYMNYPYDEELFIDVTLENQNFYSAIESVTHIYEYAEKYNPIALKADYYLQKTKYDLKITKGKFSPTFSMSGGINTYFVKAIGNKNSNDLDESSFWNPEKPTLSKDIDDYRDSKVSFWDQLDAYRSEYIRFSVTIPIFDQLNKITSLRKSKNNVRIAEAQKEETLRQLQTTIEKNVLDKEGYSKEIIQMEKQVNANELAYRLTSRQYEEGLMSSIDLQTSSNTLIQSRAMLLQKKLLYIIKDKMVDYYKGVPLIQE